MCRVHVCRGWWVWRGGWATKAEHLCMSIDASRVGKRNVFSSFFSLPRCGTGFWGPPQVHLEGGGRGCANVAYRRLASRGAMIVSFRLALIRGGEPIG